MAHASRKHIGEGSQGKGDGSGAMTHMDLDKVGPNDILSNRDKSLHSDARGLDGKAIKSEQYQDHAANRIVPVSKLESPFGVKSDEDRQD